MQPKTREQKAGEMYRQAVGEVSNGAHNIEMLARHIEHMLTGIQKFPGPMWRERLVPPEGKHVVLDKFEDYLRRPAREGLGFKSLHQVDLMLKAAGKAGTEALTALRAEIHDWDQRVSLEKTRQTSKAAPALAQHGGERTKADEQGDIGTLNRGSNSAAYLAARIKRDAPEIAARVEKGEFKSMRAAAKAAGIVKDRSPLERVQSIWQRCTAQEQEKIRDWLERA
jgi:hypothetical protein